MGAELASRSMTTLLTWETRRGRVFVAKAVAAVTASTVFALLVLVLVSLAMWPALRSTAARCGRTTPRWPRSPARSREGPRQRARRGHGLLLGNVIVFVSGHDNAGEVTGRTVTAAGIFLTAVAVTLLASAAGAFYRRDVA